MKCDMARDDYIDEVFAPSGLLARAFDGYRVRTSQITAARAIDFAIRAEENAAIEAPTGVGKSMAYLVPIIKVVDEAKAAGKPIKCIVSTANITLQNQLINKDLPALRGILPWKFSYAVLKGRQNYLCKRAQEFMQDNDSTVAENIKQWARTTATGDKSEIGFQVEPLWHKFSVSGDECIGDRCKFQDECWSEMARCTAFEADVIVTNHMMLSLHLQILQETSRALVLPKFSYLIIDEAHELPVYARKVWGTKISTRAIDRAIAPWKRLSDVRLDDLETVTDRCFQEAYSLLASLKGRSPRITLEQLTGILQPIAASMVRLIQDLKRYEKPDVAVGDEYGDYKEGQDRVQQLLTRVESLLKPADDQIYWLEPDNRGQTASVHSTVLEIGPYLKDSLFESAPSVIAMSATLATGDGPSAMQYTERELGLTRHRNYVLPSPFDLPAQLRVVAPIIPEPTSKNFEEELVKAVEETIIQARGRTLVLFTSFRVMEIVYQAISLNKRVKYPVFKQGDASVSKLIDRFKQDISSVLFGVASLWTGIDVPGEALSCLVIDRFPFTTPTDPLLSALQEKYGRDCFYRVQLPSAVMRFRQGAGRLIRTDTDKGAIVIMDRRLTSKPYGSQFISSFGGVRVTKRISDIGEFLR